VISGIGYTASGGDAARRVPGPMPWSQSHELHCRQYRAVTTRGGCVRCICSLLSVGVKSEARLTQVAFGWIPYSKIFWRKVEEHGRNHTHCFMRPPFLKVPMAAGRSYYYLLQDLMIGAPFETPDWSGSTNKASRTTLGWYRGPSGSRSTMAMVTSIRPILRWRKGVSYSSAVLSCRSK
jgi:hypothetical protein